MSQAGQNNSSAGPVPPTVATSYITDNGTAVPALSVLLVEGKTSSEDNANGIIAKGGVVGTGTGNEIDLVLTNRFSASTTTNGAVTSNVITFPLGIIPGTYFLIIHVAVFNASGPAGAGYETYTTVRTDGTIATIIDATDSITQEDATLIATTAQFVTSANNAIFQVGGVVGLKIDWVVTGSYVKAI